MDWKLAGYLLGEQDCLGYLLDSSGDNAWIYPYISMHEMNTGCGLATEGDWKDTTKLKAYQSNGTITLFYSGRKL